MVVMIVSFMLMVIMIVSFMLMVIMMVSFMLMVIIIVLSLSGPNYDEKGKKLR